MFSAHRNDCLFVVYVWLFAGTVIAQNLTVPSTWMNSTSTLTRESREALANGAATALATQANPSSGTSANLPLIQDVAGVFAVLANQDYYSGNTSWSGLVPSGIQDNAQKNGLYAGLPAYNSDAIYWGLAYFYAYRTYKQQSLLDLAISAYNATYESFITPQAAASGTGAGRNVSFAPPSRCTNKTIAGGVFWAKTQKDDTTINAETIAPFMALSAYLFEQSNNTLYQRTAQLSLDFIINYLWNGTVVLDGFDPKKCTVSTALLTYDQAWFVEGLSVMANVTNNGTLTKILENVVPSVVNFPQWTLSNGVIGEAPARDSLQATLKGIFIRALTEARARNPGTDLAKYIEAYIMVQFNSLINNAIAPNTNYYTTSWFGPSNTSFSATGNLAALDVLNAAFTFDAPTSAGSAPGNSTSGSIPNPSSSASGSSPTSTGLTNPTSTAVSNFTSSSNTSGATNNLLPTYAFISTLIGGVAAFVVIIVF